MSALLLIGVVVNTEVSIIAECADNVATKVVDFANSTLSTVQYMSHRRRIELEDKAKVVASVWGTESLLR